MASQSVIDVATAFFEACETGKGWEGCKEFATADATFECAVLPQKRLDEYTEWMKGLVSGIAPDAKYEILSKTSNETQVVFVCLFHGTHTLPGGPVPVADPPKKMSCPYTYTITVDPATNKVTSLYKVFDIFSGFSAWGWPLPGQN
eukprot:CAMPEP_0177655664 /NCGR_PEP_ID=MMETSP0447-20121125/15105_1 /TAXON_ID=0 /ORGANISM="Stygamoeba regulata, Strain BSH-02190019" /LENGTH=145 /DNA_ID=CAMNT_0019159633 /DNA_START=134 /DNA_END=571 /DNA_ORIENTATION=-